MKKIKTAIMIMIGICGLTLMLWFILPSVYIRFTYVPVAVCSVMVTFFAFINDRRHILYYFAIFSPCLVVALDYYLVAFNMGWKPALNIFQQMVIFTAPAMLTTYLLNLDKNNDNYNRLRKFSVVFALLCIALIYIVTMHELSIHPNVCRALASGEKNETLTALRQRNIGGFGYSYAIGILEVFTFFSAIRSKGNRQIVYSLVTAALLIYVVRSQYMTLLILCIVINLLTSLRFAKSFIIKVFIIASAVLILVFAGPISGLLAQIVTGEKMSERMYQISGLFNGAGYENIRLDYIRGCLSSISQHFFFGRPNLLNDYEAYNISIHSHSTQFKILVDSGFVGFVFYNFYLLFMRYYLVRLIAKTGNNPEPFIMAFWFVWLLSWLNPVFEIYEIPFLLFLVIPLLICFNIRERKTVKKNNYEINGFDE